MLTLGKKEMTYDTMHGFYFPFDIFYAVDNINMKGFLIMKNSSET